MRHHVRLPRQSCRAPRCSFLSGAGRRILHALVLAAVAVEKFSTVFVDSDEQSGQYAKVSAAENFVTAGGENGVTWSAHGPKNAAESWLVSSGTSLAFMPVKGPAASWSSVEAELAEMANSIVVTEPAQGSGP